MGGEGIEAVGDAVTGGVVARAVEPQAGEGDQAEAQKCLNCGTPLVGDYCHGCGQPGHVHRTLSAFWHDLLHGVLHFEGKIWRTLPLLAWRPGELTRRYVEGERARFVSPLALFLFAVFLMFATFTTIGGPVGGDETEAEFAAERSEVRGRLARLERERAAAAAAGRDTSDLDERITDLRVELGALNVMDGDLPGAGTAAVPKEAPRTQEAGNESAPAAGNDAAAEAGNESAAAAGNEAAPAAEKAEEGRPGWLNAAYKKAKENPSLLFYKLQNNAYKFSWALIPISVPFVWLLFLHRRRYREYRAYDHTIFVTYSIAFMTLLVVSLSVLRFIGVAEGFVILALTVVPPLHMYHQLRGAYRLGPWSAVWRTVLLLQFATIAASLFFLLLLMIGLG